jgi:hypothetical protein
MDNLSKFYFEDLNEESLKEIQKLSVDELTDLKKEDGVLIIKNKKTGQKGQSNYSNLIVLDSLGIRDRFEIVGFKINNVKKEFQVETQITVQHEVIADEFIQPEIPIFSEKEKEEKNDFELEVFTEEPKKRGRKSKN